MKSKEYVEYRSHCNLKINNNEYIIFPGNEVDLAIAALQPERIRTKRNS